MVVLSVPVVHLPTAFPESNDVVATADGLLTTLIREAPACLYGARTQGMSAYFLLWPGRDGPDREVFRFPGGRGFRAVLARFGHWYMGGQVYGGECRVVLEQEGSRFRVWMRMGNTPGTGFWFQAVAEVLEAEESRSLADR